MNQDCGAVGRVRGTEAGNVVSVDESCSGDVIEVRVTG